MANRSKKRKVTNRGASLKSAVAQPSYAWFNHDWMGGLVLLLAVILIYQPIWYAGYIWDDDLHLTANRCIVGPFGFKEIWTTSAAQYYPLVLSTFWMEHALWGLAPLPYHIVNILLHGACGILLWRVLRNLQVPGAWLGAALWTLHPVQVESAAWITEMKNTESGVFFLLSILFYVKMLRARRINDCDKVNYALTLLFSALAMASKSSTVILPLVLCLCAWWIEGRWQWRNLVRVAPIFLMSVFAGALSLWTQGAQLATATEAQWTRTWPERLATAGDVVWFYLGKLLWPHPLITIYPRWEIDAGQLASYLPLLTVMIVLFILWLNRRSFPRGCFFAWSYFLIALLPVLGLVNQPFWIYSFVADHFQYLASMGPLALIGAGLTRAVNFIIPGKSWLQAVLCAGLLLILGMMSWQRAWAYESEETLWTDTLAKNPNCWLAHCQMGQVLSQNGREDEAIAEYQKGLAINPNIALAHNNVGEILDKEGQVDAAMIEFQRAQELEPTEVNAYDNLGNALFQKGNVDEAISQYQKALKIDPYYAAAYANLGVALYQKGQLDKAMVQYQKALEMDPTHSEMHYDLANILLQKGHVDEAIAHYQKALEINPNNAAAHDNLGVAFFQKGQLDQAIDEFQEALRLQPDYARAQDSLAKAEALVRERSGRK